MLTWVRVGAVLLVVAWLGGEALACGDKFLVPGRRAPLGRGPVAREPAAVLVFARPASAFDRTLQSTSTEARLRKAGYRPTLVTSEPELERALRGGAWDVLLVDLTDGPEVIRRLSSGPPTIILPVAYGVERAVLDRAKRQYRQVLRSPKDNRAFLEAIDAVLAERARGRAMSPRRVGG